MKRWSLEFFLEGKRDLFKLDRAIQRRLLNNAIIDWF